MDPCAQSNLVEDLQVLREPLVLVVLLVPTVWKALGPVVPVLLVPTVP